jgi:single-strand DNA-binding protein
MISLSIIGNIGGDAIVKEVGSKKVINFSVCHTEKYKDANGNQQEKSTWVECAKWGETTGILPYLLKGTKVFVEGKPEINLYAKKDGEPGGSIRVQVNKIELLGGKGEQSQSAAPVPANQPAGPAVQDTSDLPF